MDSVLQNVDSALVYLDEILIASSTEKEHLDDLKAVFRRLTDHGLVIRLEKCLFGVSSLKFLAHQVSKKGSSPTQAKVKVIQTFPQPSTVKGLQEFLVSLGIDYTTVARARAASIDVQDYKTASTCLEITNTRLNEQDQILCVTFQQAVHVRLYFLISDAQCSTLSTISHIQESKPQSKWSRTNLFGTGCGRRTSSFTYILTIIDRNTRWPEAFPQRGITTPECVHALITGWIARFGVRGDISSDRGS
ncbi:hypothetical protein RRG08_012457 [Elysia crispata]|uniref:Reverse transcriptase domain-containing protein n=1 Tax=Elysia crispata TaxID=231223 RepID=A0AAE0Z9B7_9GAST|nr:hypothetical protein RRG08_012457 [Elysia crispata]